MSLITTIILYIQEKIKDVPVSGSEGVEMAEHEADSGGGEDPSSLQLTTADGECVLAPVHCEHYSLYTLL